jgi:cell division protein FtsQ
LSSTAIDPRIRARRVAVQRDEGRKRLRRLGVAGGLVGVLATAWGIAMTPLLDVDHIRVSGAAHSDAAAVATATGIHRGDALLTTRMAPAAGRVARLPWVQRVDVRRQWPGTIEVTVVERTAAAAVPAKAGGWVLLDRSGRQLAVVPEPDGGLLRVEVPPVDAAPGRSLGADTSAVLELAASRPAALHDRLLALRPLPGGAVQGTVALRDGKRAVVELGRPSQATAKWLALVSVLDQADPKGLVRIDVRVPSAPALTRR